jgi:hypothetical protein
VLENGAFESSRVVWRNARQALVPSRVEWAVKDSNLRPWD